MPNLKLKLLGLLAVVLFSLGLYLGKTYLQDKHKEAVMTQQQSQNCKAVSTKVTDKNGKVTESVSFESASSQDQKLAHADQKVVHSHSVILLKDQLSYSYKYIKLDMLDISPLLQVREDKSFHLGLKVDF